MQAQRAQKLLQAVTSKKVPIRNCYGSGHGPVATYNDLPSPQGSWQTFNDAQQRKYNAHLIGGVAFFVGTLIFGKAAGLLHMNYSPPDMPVESNDYKN